MRHVLSVGVTGSDARAMSFVGFEVGESSDYSDAGATEGRPPW